MSRRPPNWADDPLLADEVRARAVRHGIIRSAVIWTPLVLGGLVLALFFLFDVATGGDSGGTWFLVVVLAIITGLFGFQSIQALMDLRSEPVSAVATVGRRWSRSDSLVMKSHYIRLTTGQILRGDVVTLAGVKEGDRVRLSYYPHTAVISRLDKVAADEAAEGGAAPE